MAIIVEDGTIVPNANSFVTRAEYIVHALSIGIVIPDADAADAELIKAAQYIASHEANLKGTLVDRDQPMPYPRNSLVIDGWNWSYDEIPRQVILAQLSLAIDVNSGEDLYNPTVNRVVTKERVEGAVTVEYSSKNIKFVKMMV